jgi:hypothetical protein
MDTIRLCIHKHGITKLHTNVTYIIDAIPLPFKTYNTRKRHCSQRPRSAVPSCHAPFPFPAPRRSRQRQGSRTFDTGKTRQEIDSTQTSKHLDELSRPPNVSMPHFQVSANIGVAVDSRLRANAPTSFSMSFV